MGQVASVPAKTEHVHHKHKPAHKKVAKTVSTWQKVKPVLAFCLKAGLAIGAISMAVYWIGPATVWAGVKSLAFMIGEGLQLCWDVMPSSVKIGILAMVVGACCVGGLFSCQSEEEPEAEESDDEEEEERALPTTRSPTVETCEAACDSMEGDPLAALAMQEWSQYTKTNRDSVKAAPKEETLSQEALAAASQYL